MSEKNWVLHKFGGTSLGDDLGFLRVLEILKSDLAPRKAIVVSAMSGVTDQLINLVHLAKAHDESYKNLLEDIKSKYLQTLKKLCPNSDLRGFQSALDQEARNLHDLLRGVWVAENFSKATLDLISGYGELWSAQLLSTVLNNKGANSTWLDARLCLRVSEGEAGPAVNWKATHKLLQKWLGENLGDHQYMVITGFIARDESEAPTTLQRNGSDFSASIFGKLLQSSLITIWTDVNGVMSADPRKVPEAFVIDRLTYNEAMELAFFGAKVLHPNTMAPAIDSKIPIKIRNSFKAEESGTLICDESYKLGNINKKSPVKGFSCIENIALLSLEGTGMIGVPGIAERMFGTLKDAGVSVITISQASSEHSICCTVPAAQSDIAINAIKQTFYFEFNHGQIQNIKAINSCSILAAVGDNMIEVPGVSARLFSSLAQAGVNVRAIAQGSSERNISIVIDASDTTKALRASHAGFYLSDQTLSVGVIGPGLIGKTFLNQLSLQKDYLKKTYRIDIRLRALMNSSKMYLDDKSIDLNKWQDALANSVLKPDIDKFTNHIIADHIPQSVIIDCTSSQDVADKYLGWRQKGIHIITPNKKANSGNLDYYKSLHPGKTLFRSHYLYETTVGAGLPVIVTLKDLLKTGDKILRVEGIFSGTLSYIFNTLNSDFPFSEVVKQAKQNGFTEPDPRDDLSGMDVARKVVILAREMGLNFNLNDLNIESLVPKELDGSFSVEDFLNQLSKYDSKMQQKLNQAEDDGQVLRYVGVIEGGQSAYVKIKPYPMDHPFARLTGSDNIIAFTTERYRHQPLIVQGPGAGPEVTAGGVFADLLRLANYLGAAQ